MRAGSPASPPSSRPSATSRRLVAVAASTPASCRGEAGGRYQPLLGRGRGGRLRHRRENASSTHNIPVPFSADRVSSSWGILNPRRQTGRSTDGSATLTELDFACVEPFFTYAPGACGLPRRGPGYVLSQTAAPGPVGFFSGALYPPADAHRAGGESRVRDLRRGRHLHHRARGRRTPGRGHGVDAPAGRGRHHRRPGRGWRPGAVCLQQPRRLPAVHGDRGASCARSSR